jgi:membrane protease YdiL (CAAX protease family)
LLGLVFGYAVHRSRSVFRGVVAHALNNLASLG